jgi:hypothetical protein
MRRINIFLIFILLIIIAGFAAFHYLFSIYEVIYKITPQKLYADNSSTVVIDVVPLNSLGWKAPFRKAYSDFILVEGKELVDVILIDNVNGKLILKAKEKPGKVTITIKSKYSLLPSTLEIIIEPNVA